MSVKTSLTAVANAIREKTGKSEMLTIDQMPNEIKSIETGGSNIDWSNITDMKYAFYDNSQLFNLLAPTINNSMSGVKDWSYAFYYAIGNSKSNTLFQNAGFVFTKISERQFQGCTELNNINIRDLYYDDITYAFDGCIRLPFSKAIEILENNNYDSPINNVKYGYAFQKVGNGIYNEFGTYELKDLTLKGPSMTGMFYYVKALKKVGNITSISSSDAYLSKLFCKCENLEEIGTITVSSLSSTSTNIVDGCIKLKKFGGIILSSQEKEAMSSQTSYLLSSGNMDIEEIENIPISYFRYGAANILNFSGTESNIRPLKRLTFSSSEIPYISNYSKSFSIAYCSFNREGMVEMFTSLPDASDITGAKAITIKGNPCVADGTLTEEDIAIATAKGYSIIKE